MLTQKYKSSLNHYKLSFKSMLELCQDIAKSNPQIKLEAIVGKELLDKGLNLIYSVGRGASKKPCLVILKYEGRF